MRLCVKMECSGYQVRDSAYGSVTEGATVCNMWLIQARECFRQDGYEVMCQDGVLWIPS